MVPRALGTPADDAPHLVLGSFPMGRELQSRVTPAREVSGAESSAHVECCCTAGRRQEGVVGGPGGEQGTENEQVSPPPGR